jgi:hypothetical protein
MASVASGQPVTAGRSRPIRPASCRIRDGFVVPGPASQSAASGVGATASRPGGRWNAAHRGSAGAMLEAAEQAQAAADLQQQGGRRHETDERGERAGPGRETCQRRSLSPPHPAPGPSGRDTGRAPHSAAGRAPRRSPRPGRWPARPGPRDPRRSGRPRPRRHCALRAAIAAAPGIATMAVAAAKVPGHAPLRGSPRARSRARTCAGPAFIVTCKAATGSEPVRRRDA